MICRTKKTLHNNSAAHSACALAAGFEFQRHILDLKYEEHWTIYFHRLTLKSPCMAAGSIAEN